MLIEGAFGNKKKGPKPPLTRLTLAQPVGQIVQAHRLF